MRREREKKKIELRHNNQRQRNNNIQIKKKERERLESSSNNTRSAQVQNRYEVCIYDKQTKEKSVCVTVVDKVFSLFKACSERYTIKRRKKIELEETTRI